VNGQGKRIHHAEPGVREFVGIDGEGIYRKGQHRYALLGIGSEYITDNTGINWRESFEFMYGFRQKGRAICGFYLSYDFNQLFKTLPEDKAWMLLSLKGRSLRQSKGKSPQPWPVRCDGWEFDILGMKRLKLRPKPCDCEPERGKTACKCPKPPWLYVCDTGPFFQQSLLAVIDPRKWQEPIVTPEEYEIILEGKRRRSEATRIDDDMIRYNQLENVILCRALRSLDRGFRDMGVCLPPSKWFGPGQAAQGWLRGEGVKPTKDIEPVIPKWYLEAARKSYYGGWFEIMAHGIIPGDTHEYDINSAYPYIISQLPCLEHGTYSRGEGLPNVSDKELCLVRARVWSRSPLTNHAKTSKNYIGAMLHRDPSGNIWRPTVTEGWFWWHELESAIAAGIVQRLPRKARSELHPICYEWVKYSPCDCFPPMRRVISLYLRRQAVGKDTPLGKGAKTSYNSMYGKFAQSVGSPVFGNPIYASLITAGCRKMILDAIASHPIGKKDVTMVATDAVYFRTPHPTLTIGEGLGEWGHKTRRNLCQFKPGVYWDDSAREAISNGDSPHFKARGISAKDFGSQISNVDNQFRSLHRGKVWTKWPEIVFPVSFALTTCNQALERKAWETAGEVITDGEARQSADPSTKRTGLYKDGDIWRTEPYEPEPEFDPETFTYEWHCESSPYEKRFGLEDPFSYESKELPGLSPDGNIGDLYSFALKGIMDD
jgi:hypothetical protein